MKRSEIVKWGVVAILVAAAATVIFASSGCEVTREVILDPSGLPTGVGGVPTGVERVVVEGPGGDMVAVGHEVVERLAPLLPEPWNTVFTALAAGFSAVFGSWVFRNRKKK